MAEEESVTIPFWFDNIKYFYYLPENKIINLEEDIYQRLGFESSKLAKSKTWWNSNIPMDDFIPTLIPCERDSSEKLCQKYFIERIKQRAEGKLYPTPPEIKLKPSLLILDKNNTNTIMGFVFNHPDNSDKLQIAFSKGDNILSISEKIYDINEIINRDNNCIYWDMYEKRYI